MISGQQLPKVNVKEDSIVDPLVRVEIHGVPMDQAKQETRYIENNGAEKAVGLYTSEHIVTTGHPKYYAVCCSRIKDYPQTDRGVHSIVHTQGWDVDPAGGNNEWMNGCTERVILL